MGRRLAAVVVEYVDHDGPAGELLAGSGGLGEERPALEGDLAICFVEANEAKAGRLVLQLLQHSAARRDRAVGHGEHGHRMSEMIEKLAGVIRRAGLAVLARLARLEPAR